MTLDEVSVCFDENEEVNCIEEYSPAVCTATIVNDDIASVVGFSSSSSSKTEGDMASSTLQAPVSMDVAPLSSVSIDVFTVALSATSGVDYIAASTTLIFLAVGHYILQLVTPQETYLTRFSKF